MRAVRQHIAVPCSRACILNIEFMPSVSIRLQNERSAAFNRELDRPHRRGKEAKAHSAPGIDLRTEGQYVMSYNVCPAVVHSGVLQGPACGPGTKLRPLEFRS